MKQKIIATGITGMVGSRIRELLAEKYDFVSFSLEDGVDILNYGLLKSKFEEHRDASAVLHLAAFTNVDAAWEQRGDRKRTCYRINVEGTRNITHLAYKNNLYVIAISTDFVFDGKNPPAGGYTEEDIPRPIEWYGYTKFLAEKEVLQSGVKNAILRIAFPYKAKPASKELEPIIKLDLVRNFKTKLKAKKKLSLFGDQIITLTFIDDTAVVTDSCLSRRHLGIYHCVGSTSLSPFEIAVQTAKTFDLNKALISKTSLDKYLKTNLKTRPRQKNLTLSNKKIENDLGIKMATLVLGLEQCKKQINP